PTSVILNNEPTLMDVDVTRLRRCDRLLRLRIRLRPIQPFSAPFALEDYRLRFLLRVLRFRSTLGFASGLAVKRTMAPPIRRHATLTARSTKGPHSSAR